jgi:hypothetical protein
MIRKFLLSCLLVASLQALPLQTLSARPIAPPAEEGAPVDLVIALDVSGSMSGLIESAKQRLWDIVNEIARAQPAPDLRLAIVTYGNPAYGAQSGFVRIDQAFTRDLDAVMKTLFSFGTNGGDEFVARAVHSSVNELEWSAGTGGLKILFVAGNEAANQDPDISILQATQAAISRGIVVNTLYCGNEGDDIVAGWRNVANLTNGLFASIDQDAVAVANIATPMDQALAELNVALNETYIAYGKEGAASKANQLAQDENASDMSAPSAASRAVAKAGRLYRNDGWDLVDAMESGVEIEALEEEALPPELQEMSSGERREYVEGLAEKRQQVSAEIAELGKKREDYIATERARNAEADDEGLDEAILGGLRKIAAEKGFEFGN